MSARRGTGLSGWCLEGRCRWCRFALCQCEKPGCECAKRRENDGCEK